MEQSLSPEHIKLVNILGQFYCKPVRTDSALLYSTAQIFARLQSVYPSESYKPEDVYHVLTYLQYETLDSHTYQTIMWYIQEVEK